MNTGKTIAELRTEKGISQQALADRLFISRDLVSKWENGRRTPDLPTVKRLSEIFGVPSEAIIDPNDMAFEELSECVDGVKSLPKDKLTETLNAFTEGLGQKSASVFVLRYCLLLEYVRDRGEKRDQREPRQKHTVQNEKKTKKIPEGG